MESSYTLTVRFFDSVSNKEWIRYQTLKAESEEEAKKIATFDLKSESRKIKNIDVYKVTKR